MAATRRLIRGAFDNDRQGADQRTERQMPPSRRGADDRDDGRGQRSDGDQKRDTRGTQARDDQPQLVDARALAGALRDVLRDRQAPAFRGASRRSQWTQRDFDLLARDEGVSDDQMDRRNQSQERTRRDRLDHRQGITRDRDERVELAGPVRKRQFHEMRGQRLGGARAGETQLPRDSDVGIRFSQYIGYLAGSNAVRGHIDHEWAYQRAREERADPTVVRALGESTLAGGGALVPEAIAEDYIELLYAVTVYLQGNPMRLEAPNGNLTMPGIATGAAGAWVGENANITKSEQTFRQVKIDLKYLGVIVPVSNRLIRHSPLGAESFIREDIIANASELIDTAAIRGLGTAHQPRGLRYAADTGNVFAQTGVTLAAVTTDTAKMNRLIEANKIRGLRKYWIMSPRSRWFLMSLRDGNGNLQYRDEMIAGTFLGFPFGVTMIVPETLGGGTESELYLCDFSHQIYAEGVGEDGLSVTVQDGAAYHDGSSVVAGFSQNQSVFRLIQSCDIQTRQQGKEISVLTGVTWGV